MHYNAHMLSVGALVCLAQTDVKRLIAYSSVRHMGFVTLGLFALTQNQGVRRAGW
nr:proton-conducting transporter membrane subunit [Desulfovibrio desulfuricans]